jgi:serine/threonine-protein kinase
MSPEQIREVKDVDARSDVWALGITLFELLVGRPPFVSPAFGELCSMILSQPASLAHILRSDVPAHLSATIQRCLEKNSSGRFADAGALGRELKEDLRRLNDEGRRVAHLAGESAHVPQAPTWTRLQVTSTATPLSCTTPASASKHLQQQRRRWAAGGAVMTLTACVGMLIHFGARTPPNSTIAAAMSTDAANGNEFEGGRSVVVPASSGSTVSPPIEPVARSAETIEMRVPATTSAMPRSHVGAPLRRDSDARGRTPRAPKPALTRDLLEDHY